jgi:phosphate transport system permease protein
MWSESIRSSMNKSPDKPLPAQGDKKAIDIVNAGLAKRYSAEKRFQAMGIAAIALSLLFLVILFGSIFANGYTAFFQTYVQVDVLFSEDYIDPQDIPGSNFPGLVKKSLRNMFPDVSGRGDRRQLYAMVSSDAGFRLQRMVAADPGIIGATKSVWVLADDDVDMLVKGHIDRNVAEDERRMSDKQLVWFDALVAEGRVEKRFNTVFFTAGDSREPEMAGILGATLGSFYTLVVTLLLLVSHRRGRGHLPGGIRAQEPLDGSHRGQHQQPRRGAVHRLRPAGLAVFINFFGMPRSTPLVAAWC